MMTASLMLLPAGAPRAAWTAMSTRLFTPSCHVAACQLRALNVSVNGADVTSCTAARASSAVMPPTSIPWIFTPGWIVTPGPAASTGETPTRAPIRRAAATTPRIVMSILLTEEVGIVRNRRVGLGASEHSPDPEREGRAQEGEARPHERRERANGAQAEAVIRI